MAGENVRRDESPGVRDETLAAEIAKYEAALAQDPKSRSFALLAESYRKAGRFQDAIRVAEAGLQHFPHYLSGRAALARAYFETGNHDRAMVEFEQVIKAAPDNLMAHRHLAEIYQGQGRLPDAAKSLRMVALLDPRDEQARMRLAAITPDRAAVPPPPAKAAPVPPATTAPSAPTPGAPSPRPAPQVPPKITQATVSPAAAPPSPMEHLMEGHRHVELPPGSPRDEPSLEVMTDQEMIHQPELSRREEVPAPAPVFGDEDAFDAAFGEYEAPPPAVPPAGIREAAAEALPEALPDSAVEELPEPDTGFPGTPEPAIAPPREEPFRSTDEQVLEEDSYVFGRPRFDEEPEMVAEEEDEEAVAEFLEETTGEAAAPGAVEEPWERVQAPPEDRVRTETMAEIYFHQGLFAEALDIYHHLATIRPGDRIIGDRILEIERRIEEAAHPVMAPPFEAEPEPVAAMSHASPREAEALRTLKEWLSRLKTRY